MMSSPTLSEMEFGDLEAPTVTLVMINGLEKSGSNPSSSIAPPSGPIATKPKQNEESQEDQGPDSLSIAFEGRSLRRAIVTFCSGQ